ncbi:MAG: tetratricopeptide repeat protein [Ignavibacteria bacterium]|jgi:signal transduction histidine kinase/DNA-binding response OmpR family regulator
MYKYLKILFLLLVITTSAQENKTDSLKTELEKDIPDTVRLGILFELGNILINSNLDEALGYAEKSFELAKSAGSKKQIINSRRLLASVHRQIGNYHTAKNYYLKNLQSAKEIADSIMMRKTYQDLGAVHINLGDFDKAIYNLIEAAELAKILKDKNGQAGIYANIGLALISNNDPGKALDYLQESLQLYEELENTAQVVVGYLRITRVYVNKTENEKAFEYELKALEKAEQLNNDRILSLTYGELAATALNLKRLNESKIYAEKSLAIKEKIGTKRGIAASLYTLGSIELELGNYSGALAILQRSQKLLEEMNAKEQVMEGLKVIANTSKNMGNYEEAFNYYERYAELRDSILNEKSSKQIAEIETKYNVREKEAELELRETELANQRTVLLGTAIISILLIALLLLAYRNIKQRKKINDQLKELDKSKSRFFANISHELRTPLTLILAPLQKLIENTRDKSILKELKLMHSNSNKLLNLTEEVMELSKLESGTIELHESAVNINDLCKRIIFSYQSLAQFRQLVCKYNFKLDDDTTVLLDINKFEKILNNLISNAFKHSHSGGKITLTVSRSEDTIRFSVKDKGEGIHPDDLPHIFNRYYQTERKDMPERGGAGIGLALANELAKLFKGNIEVKSEWQKGSEFVLSIPFKEAHKKIEPSPDKLFEDTEFEKPGPVYQPLFINGQKPKLLIVEDNIEMSRYLIGILADDYNCKPAPDGKEALNIMKKENFDLIISDIMMPNMDGFEFRENVIENPDWKFTPFIMLTARTPEEDKIKGFQLGVDDYITKPFNPRELFARIHNLLNNKIEREKWIIENPAEAFEDTQLSAEESLISKAEEAVMENLDNVKFTASELAEKLSYSQRQLERLLKKITGLSPNAFIREIRLNKAYKMLEKRQFQTVLEVCYNVGFENPSYFSKKFAERFGKRPSEL